MPAYGLSRAVAALFGIWLASVTFAARLFPSAWGAQEMMRICGCLLVEVPFAKVWHPDHFVTFSRRLAKKMDAVWGGQFDNLANRAAHYNSTGPELWEQCDGRLDGFVSSVGTGGTLTGVAAYLREQCPSVRIALADVPGAVLHRYYTTGKFKAVGSSITENIGPPHGKPRKFQAR
eukprot:GHVT01050167.1.p2 GENE.GHVT01050167.1~~GHVT01050167.1.p2  ORF type:complete len:176 (-),score=30.12 GHVT01050167.1:643-1170(-)